jgi:hypothetical protein
MSEDVRQNIFVVLALLASLLPMFARLTYSQVADARPPYLGLEQLVPDPAFRLGMSVDELEKVIQASYPGWKRLERKRALNNRKDPSLPAGAKAPYLQTISILHVDSMQGIGVKYDFVLTSPLSGSRIYSILHSVEALDPAVGLTSITRWATDLQSKWGDRHSGVRTATRERATYFFDDKDVLLDNGAEKCEWTYSAFYRLDEQSIEQVTSVVNLVNSTGCTYVRDNFVGVTEDDIITNSFFYHIDSQRQAADVLKRVAFEKQ